MQHVTEPTHKNAIRVSPNLQEVPYADWPAKDKASYAVVRQAIGEAQVEAWHDLFRRSQ